MIDIGPDFVVGVGPNCPFLVIKEVRLHEGEPAAG
jgi:hypothetical protein